MATRSAASVRAVPRRGLSFRTRERLLGYLLVLPMIAVMIGLLAYPFFQTILITFTNQYVGMRPGTLKFVGLANYAYVINWPDFALMIKNTIVMTLGAVALKTIWGMLGALTLNESLRGRGLYRGLVFLPWATPALVATLLWRWLMDTQNGVLNFLLVENLHLFRDHIAWLADPTLAMPSVIVALFWQGVPFYLISFLAALQAVPVELYEAAKVDGANAVQRFRFITFPSIRHVVIIVTMLSTIWTSQDFVTPYALTLGGPANTTMVFSLLTYILAIQDFQIAEGAAIPVIVFPIFATMIIILTRFLQSREGEV